MSIFDNKLYPSAMYLLILMVLLLIAFSFAGISNKINPLLNNNQIAEEKLKSQNYKITGLATKDADKKNDSDTNETSDDKGKGLYTEKAYFTYYLILFFTFIFIIIIIFIALLPVIKSYS